MHIAYFLLGSFLMHTKLTNKTIKELNKTKHQNKMKDRHQKKMK